MKKRLISRRKNSTAENGQVIHDPDHEKDHISIFLLRLFLFCLSILWAFLKERLESNGCLDQTAEEARLKRKTVSGLESYLFEFSTLVLHRVVYYTTGLLPSPSFFFSGISFHGASSSSPPLRRRVEPTLSGEILIENSAFDFSTA